MSNDRDKLIELIKKSQLSVNSHKLADHLSKRRNPAAASADTAN